MDDRKTSTTIVSNTKRKLKKQEICKLLQNELTGYHSSEIGEIKTLCTMIKIEKHEEGEPISINNVLTQDYL